MNTFPFKASHYAPPNPDYFQRHLSACFSWLNGTVWPCNTFVAPFFPPSTASRHCAQWDRGQRLHCRLCGHKKATILLGFMIIRSKIKTHLMPQKKKKISLWLRAVAGASKCEDKVERNHDVSLGVVPLFMTPHVWHKRCKVARWFEQHSDGSFITADSVNTYFLQLTCVVSQLWCRSKLLLNFRYFFFTSLKSVNECELKFKRT